MATPLYDAHCHPTDTMEAIGELSKLKAAGLCIMATRSTDQVKVSDTAQDFPEKIIPCFGFHPWFVHSIYDDSEHKQVPDKKEHFKSILKPEPEQAFIDAMPDLVPLSKYVKVVQDNLEQHKRAMVGEVGLDRAFRIPDPNQPREDSSRHVLSKYRTSTEHQVLVLEAQLRLAGQYNRACSVHGVQASGYLYNEISRMWKGYEKPSKSQLRKQASAARSATKTDSSTREQKLEFFPDSQETASTKKAELDEEGGDGGSSSRNSAKARPFPPRICLHSYSGSADMVAPWIKSNTPAEIFFSFSQVVNGRYDRWSEVVKAVPDDKLLIESDYHDARLIDASLQQACDVVCQAKGWTEAEGRIILQRNWRRFVGGIEGV